MNNLLEFVDAGDIFIFGVRFHHVFELLS